MKTILIKLSVITFCFLALGTSVVAQSSVYYQLRDGNPNYPNPPHSFEAFIAVWDNNTNSQYGATQGPQTQYAGQYNPVYTTITLPSDDLPRWRIIIQVNEKDNNGTIIATQYRQSGLLTTAQYEAGGIPLNGITFN
ncbi:MAG: hypothetical protein EOM90_17135 [Alphaproteobacteria bacterium]|nr:hypothetical protein [Alphaproteobacteria bacterium]